MTFALEVVELFALAVRSTEIGRLIRFPALAVFLLVLVVALGVCFAFRFAGLDGASSASNSPFMVDSVTRRNALAEFARARLKGSNI